MLKVDSIELRHQKTGLYKSICWKSFETSCNATKKRAKFSNFFTFYFSFSFMTFNELSSGIVCVSLNLHPISSRNLIFSPSNTFFLFLSFNYIGMAKALLILEIKSLILFICQLRCFSLLLPISSGL